ncbi:MAG TPA: phytoene/squalene synthase family protein [Xanthomonadales bacterium]|nr:phytoene/squalene synthase family protein [Xanthomonadales bacterium]
MPDYTLNYLMRYRADMRHCRQLLKTGSRSFYTSSMLLPGYYRAPATALYAFCRVADDMIDGNQGAARDRALLELRERLQLIYDRKPAGHSVDRAFTDVVDRFNIPSALPKALIEGFEWDAHGRRYQTLSDLYGYAARVAGTVGVMMSVLMGVRDSTALARACDLGVAMQLTNIARDVGEDAREGRIYLPTQWLEAGGLNPDEWLREPKTHPVISEAIARLLSSAEDMYDRSVAGIAQLPGRCRPCIFAARSIYREIGRNITHNSIDPVQKRSIIGTRRKVQLLMAAARRSGPDFDSAFDPPLDETRFLVESVKA